MPINQVATISVPEPRMLSVQVWDKAMVSAWMGHPRLQSRPFAGRRRPGVAHSIPELNEQRRKEMVKVAHKYAEEARVAVRHVRRDGLDALKKALKDKLIGEDEEKRHETEVQKVTDQIIVEIDRAFADKEKEIMQV